MIFKYLLALEIIVWTLPLLKQFKGGYFFYFLIMAITPISSVLGYYFLKLIPFTIYVIMAYGLLLSLHYYKNKKIKKILYLFLIPITFITYYNNSQYDLVSIIILHIFIILYIINFLLKYLYNTNSMNLYFFVFIIYESSIVLKMITFLTNIQTGKLYFYITSVFELVIGIYFIFYNIENSFKYKFEKNNRLTI
jgi:hypothetical protein